MASFQKAIKTTKEEQLSAGIVPFESGEEAWFWFITAQQARNDGARFVAGQGLLPRPCEPLDILKVVDRLYRTRRLIREHLMVLRYYGRRHLPPDPRRPKEYRAHKIWSEAMKRLEPAFESKGIVKKPSGFATLHVSNQPWFSMQGMAAE